MIFYKELDLILTKNESTKQKSTKIKTLRRQLLVQKVKQSKKTKRAKHAKRAKRNKNCTFVPAISTLYLFEILPIVQPQGVA